MHHHANSLRGTLRLSKIEQYSMVQHMIISSVWVHVKVNRKGTHRVFIRTYLSLKDSEVIQEIKAKYQLWRWRKGKDWSHQLWDLQILENILREDDYQWCHKVVICGFPITLASQGKKKFIIHWNQAKTGITPCQWELGLAGQIRIISKENLNYTMMQQLLPHTNM